MIWIGFLIITAPIWIPLGIIGCIGYGLFFIVAATADEGNKKVPKEVIL
jgi:hypothetical protein